jgi:hypothetical protein
MDGRSTPRKEVRAPLADFQATMSSMSAIAAIRCWISRIIGLLKIGYLQM